MIAVPRSRLVVVARNLPAPIVKIELALQVYLAKVRLHRQAPTVFVPTQLKKAVMPVNLKVAKPARILALETQTPTPHAVLDAGSSEKT